MARLRSAPTTQPAPSATQATRQALKEKTNTVQSKPPIYENDGNADGLVKNLRPKRGQRRPAHNEDEFVMAGGLGHVEPEDKAVPSSEPPVTTDELAKSDVQTLPTVKANKRPPRMARKVVQTEAQNQMFSEMKQRMQSTAGKKMSAKQARAPIQSQDSAPSSEGLPTNPLATRRQSTKPANERSEYSLSPSPPPAGKLSAAETKRSSIAQTSSGLKPQATPAFETSILALKNFKRRPRQPSMLQMVQQRTASGRPSAVNAQAKEDPSVFDVEDVEDDEEDFAPEAEGTPLHVGKAKKASAATAKGVPDAKSKSSAAALPLPTAVNRKRKSDEADLSSSALDALKAKTQKSIDPDSNSHRLRESVPRSSFQRQATPRTYATSDVLVINSSPSSLPSIQSSPAERPVDEGVDDAVPSTERAPDEVHDHPTHVFDEEPVQDIPNGTMAEPASSSPPRAALIATQRTDVLADPLTQASPPKRDKTRAKAKAKPMTTATLQSLLPKRRQALKPRHRKSEYDILSESDENEPLDGSNEEDTEEEVGSKSRRQTKQPSSKNKRVTVSKPKSRLSKPAPTTRKSSAPPPRKSSAAPPTSKKSKKRTYGRATTSDKENESDAFEDLDENDASALPDTSISMIEAAQSKELEEARRKFADVDGWGLEFESMSGEEGRSSSQDWR